MKLLDECNIISIFPEHLHFHQIFFHQSVLNFANLQFIKVANMHEFWLSIEIFAIPCLQCKRPGMRHTLFLHCTCHSALHTIWKFGKRKKIVTTRNNLSFMTFAQNIMPSIYITYRKLSIIVDGKCCDWGIKNWLNIHEISKFFRQIEIEA